MSWCAVPSSHPPRSSEGRKASAACSNTLGSLEKLKPFKQPSEARGTT